VGVHLSRALFEYDPPWAGGEKIDQIATCVDLLKKCGTRGGPGGDLEGLEDWYRRSRLPATDVVPDPERRLT